VSVAIAHCFTNTAIVHSVKSVIAAVFIGASSFGAHYAKHRLWFYYQDFVKEQFIKFSD
jgi:RsiW-degrading membrane proteinase PrsW (M82 family)